MTSSLLLSVLNASSQEEVSIRDVRILPNLNASYLPMMPDGSVLLVDNVWCVMQLCVFSRVCYTLNVRHESCIHVTIHCCLLDYILL